MRYPVAHTHGRCVDPLAVGSDELRASDIDDPPCEADASGEFVDVRADDGSGIANRRASGVFVGRRRIPDLDNHQNASRPRIRCGNRGCLRPLQTTTS